MKLFKTHFNIKKIATRFFLLAGICGMVILLGFVNKKEDAVLCKAPTILIEDEDQFGFVSEDDISNFLRDRNELPAKMTSATIDVFSIEKALNALPSIDNADVNKTVTGEVVIRIRQRKPIARIFSLDGSSFYMDENSKLFPLSPHYTADVLIVNGYIPESYGGFYQMDLLKISEDSAAAKTIILDDVYRLAKFICHDTLLNNLIAQVYINKDREIHLIPEVGKHRIIFGTTENLEEKFAKLKIFYLQGLNPTGFWNRYTSINLTFKNQIVCTKK